MDQEDLNAPGIDAFIDRVTSGTEADAGSSPTEAAPTPEPVPSAGEAVAPPADADTSASSPAASLPDAGAVPTEPVPPTPDPSAARFEALEAQLAETTAKAQQFDAFQARLQETIAQQQRDAQQAQWAARALELENMPTAIREAESRRLVAEVEASREAEARQNYSRYQQQIHDQESATEGVAAIGAAAVQAIQHHPTLTDGEKKDLLANIQYYAQYPNPDAQTKAIQREREIESRAVARAKAEWERSTAQATAASVQERIASDVDNAGVGVGSPATTGKSRSIDDFVDSLGI